MLELFLSFFLFIVSGHRRRGMANKSLQMSGEASPLGSNSFDSIQFIRSVRQGENLAECQNSVRFATISPGLDDLRRSVFFYSRHSLNGANRPKTNITTANAADPHDRTTDCEPIEIEIDRFYSNNRFENLLRSSTFCKPIVRRRPTRPETKFDFSCRDHRGENLTLQRMQIEFDAL